MKDIITVQQFTELCTEPEMQKYHFYDVEESEEMFDGKSLNWDEFPNDIWEWEVESFDCLFTKQDYITLNVSKPEEW